MLNYNSLMTDWDSKFADSTASWLQNYDFDRIPLSFAR